jgi:hypothetical protein
MTLFKLLISGAGLNFGATYDPTYDELSVGIHFSPESTPVSQGSEALSFDAEDTDDDGEDNDHHQYP